ncbi:MAG: cadherin-like domain-containing protein [Moraxellaceae bacterium]|nr:cadherin-like domain-containing protein [Moraxellaceae bacterium]
MVFLQDNQDGTYTLTPNTNFNGLIQLDYQVDDSNGGVVDASNSVFIQAVNDTPIAPSSPISLASGLEDTAYTIQASDLLQGFSDIDSPSLSVVNLTSSSGFLQDNQDGTYTFSPNSNFNGTVQLTYQVTDNNGGIVNAANSFVVAAVNDAPTILESLLPRTSTETQNFSYTVPASIFTDIDGDVLTYTASLADNSSLPSWLSFDAVTRTFSGTPSLTDAGVLSIKVIANDGQLSANQVFTLKVNDFVVVNHPPELLSTPAILNNGTEDTAYTIQASDLLQGFSDVDGDTLSVINLSSSSGFLQDNQDGTYTFSPNPNFNGTVQLTYQVTDNNGGVVDASNSVFITPVNDLPVAPSSPISLTAGTEDTAYTIQASDLLQGFSDVDGDTLSVINLSSSSGVLQDNADGTYTLTPNANFNGSIGLTYQVSDGTDTTDASRSVFIQAVNDAPIASSSPISLTAGTEDTAYTIQASDLLQGFSDIDSPSLSVVNLTSSSGFLQDNQDGTYTLTPTKDFNGSIGLTYQVSDGTDTTDASSSVFIQAVNDAPVAPSNPISLTAGTEDTAYIIQASDLLQGFSDVEGDSLSAVNLTSSSGFLQDNQDGTYTLTPNTNFNGLIQLDYQVDDGNGGVVDATSSVFITAVNDAPVAPSNPISLTAGTEDTAYTIQASDLLQGFSDIDSPSLSVINLSSSSGLLQDNQDGTYTLTPTKDFNGSIGLTYQVSDGTDTTDASRSVFIQAVNDAPIAPSSPISLTAGTEDTAYTIQASDLLQGFSDVEGDSLSVINLSSSSGFLQDNQDGTYTFSPNSNFNGTVQLTYQVTDNNGGVVDASNSVFIQAVNDAPAILEALLPRTATETQAFSLTVPQSAFGDIDGDVLTYTASLADNSSLPSWLSFDAVTRTFSGTPSLTDAGVLSIKVIANDGQLSANQVFTLTVNDFVVVNHPPELLSTPAILNNGTEDTAYTIQASDLLQGFSDVDGDTLSVINLSSSSGFLQDNQDGTYTLTPNTNFNGLIQLDYQVDDGNGGVVDASNSVFIQAVNDAPVAPSSPISLASGLEDTAYTIQASDLLQGFSDIDSPSLSVVNLTSSSGFLQDNQDGTYTLTPTKDFNGSIGLTYQVSDGTDTTDASRSVFIQAVNDAPIAPSSPISLTAGTEDTAYTIHASDLLQGFSDIDSPSLSVINLSSSSGVLQDNADGTYTLTPNANFNGSIGLTYQVSDGTDTTDASRSVFIQAVNDAPIAPSSPISLTAGTEDTAYTINASDLLQGFSDIDSPSLSVINLSSSSGFLQDNADGTYTLTPTKDFNGSIGLTYQVSDGTDTTDASSSVSSSSGFLQDNQDGTYTLTPTKDFNGSIGLTYQVSDGTDTTDASRSVFITAVNDAPIAPSSPISLASGTEDTAYTIKAADLLNGFSDIDGDTLSVVNLTSSSGFLQDNADGTYTLTPNANFNGSIGLTYQVSDGTDTTDASRSVFIQAVNDAPIAPSSPISLTAGTEDTAYTIKAADLLNGFSDIDGDTLSVVNLSSSSGLLQDNADGTYTLTPNKDFNGSIGLTYQVSDGTDTTDASRSVFIQAVNDAPIAPSNPISLTAGTEDTAYTIQASELLQGFSDIDGPKLKRG